jgi:amino acid transporter
MTLLAKKLRGLDYFTIGFGTMVGVGWLVMMDDWLRRGGYLGAILGFACGGLLLLPIGYVYAQLVMRIPDAGGEIAYADLAFGSEVSFGTGWTMMLGYLVVCPWEAVAIGEIVSYIFPRLNSVQVYHISGYNVYLPHLIIGLTLTTAITYINYRGVGISARFQNLMTFGFLMLVLLVMGSGAAKGSIENLRPAFSHSGLVSILLVIQIMPYFMVGFESVAKCAEEAKPEFYKRDFFRAIVAAIVTGAVFYISIVAVVAYIRPWPSLLGRSFATAIAFETALGPRWIVNLILVAATLSLLKVFNGNLLAASRLLFALGRRGLVRPSFGQIHARNRTPARAIASIGLFTAVAAFLGKALLVPITEVGSMASAVGWFATCTAYCRMKPAPWQRAVGLFGALVAGLLIAMKLVPLVPGHFTPYEWLALAGWCLLGLALRKHPTLPAREVFSPR